MQFNNSVKIFSGILGILILIPVILLATKGQRLNNKKLQECNSGKLALCFELPNQLKTKITNREYLEKIAKDLQTDRANKCIDLDGGPICLLIETDKLEGDLLAAVLPLIEKQNLKKIELEELKLKSKISNYIFEPYTKDGWPKTFKKFGRRMPELQEYRIKAAKLSAKDKECLRVIASDISDRSTYDNMQFFVDCETPQGGYNFKRFRFSEGQLDNPLTKAVSEGDKALSETKAISLCESLVLNNVNYPSTLKINRFGTSYKKFKTLGNVQVLMPFKAKNAFNLELKYQARCLFKPGGIKGEITIQERV